MTTPSNALHKLAYVNRRSGRITGFAGTPDTLKRIETMKSKFVGCYSPVSCVMIVDELAEVGDMVVDTKKHGPIPGTTY